MIEPTKETSTEQKEKNLEDFRKKIIREYAQSGKPIILDDKLYKIESLKPVIGGVKVFLSNDKGELMEIGNGYGSKVIDVGKCREWFELCIC